MLLPFSVFPDGDVAEETWWDEEEGTRDEAKETWDEAEEMQDEAEETRRDVASEAACCMSMGCR